MPGCYVSLPTSEYFTKHMTEEHTLLEVLQQFYKFYKHGTKGVWDLALLEKKYKQLLDYVDMLKQSKELIKERDD